MATVTESGLNRKALKRPDDFMVATEQVFDGISKHSKAFVIAVVVMVVVGLGVAFTMNRRQERADVAKNALFEAQHALETDAKAIAAANLPPAKAEPAKDGKTKAAPAPVADPSTVAFKKLDVDTKFADAVAKLKGVAQDFDGTRSAFDARLKLGDLYFNHGEAAKAIPWYHQAVESAPGSFEKALAESAEGYAQEDAGHPAEAYASFEKALNQGEGSIKGDVLLAMARNQEALHDTAKARSIYDQILQQLPSTDYAKAAEIAKAALH